MRWLLAARKGRWPGFGLPAVASYATSREGLQRKQYVLDQPMANWAANDVRPTAGMSEAGGPVAEA